MGRKKIIDTVNLLRSGIFPKPSSNCEYCNYLKGVGNYQSNNINRIFLIFMEKL